MCDFRIKSQLYLQEFNCPCLKNKSKSLALGTHKLLFQVRKKLVIHDLLEETLVNTLNFTRKIKSLIVSNRALDKCTYGCTCTLNFRSPYRSWTNTWSYKLRIQQSTHKHIGPLDAPFPEEHYWPANVTDNPFSGGMLSNDGQYMTLEHYWSTNVSDNSFPGGILLTGKQYTHA